MKKLFAILFLLPPLTLSAGEIVTFNVTNAIGEPILFTPVKISTWSFPNVIGGGIVPHFEYLTNTGNGSFVISNLLGTIEYRMEIKASPTNTYLYFVVTNGVGSMNAGLSSTASTNVGANASRAYSIASSDAHYVAISNGVTYELRLVSTNSTTLAPGLIWTMTGTNGAGGWSNSPAGSGSGDVTTAQLNSASNVLYRWAGTVGTNDTNFINAKIGALGTNFTNSAMSGSFTNLQIRDATGGSPDQTNYIWQLGSNLIISNRSTGNWLVYNSDINNLSFVTDLIVHGNLTVDGVTNTGFTPGLPVVANAAKKAVTLSLSDGTSLMGSNGVAAESRWLGAGPITITKGQGSVTFDIGPLGTNDTNYINSQIGNLGTNDTNFSRNIIGLASTNYIDAQIGNLGTNDTNFARNVIGLAGTNNVNTRGTESTNFARGTIGLALTNLAAGKLDTTNGTPYGLTFGDAPKLAGGTSGHKAAVWGYDGTLAFLTNTPNATDTEVDYVSGSRSNLTAYLDYLESRKKNATNGFGNSWTNFGPLENYGNVGASNLIASNTVTANGIGGFIGSGYQLTNVTTVKSNGTTISTNVTTFDFWGLSWITNDANGVLHLVLPSGGAGGGNNFDPLQFGTNGNSQVSLATSAIATNFVAMTTVATAPALALVVSNSFATMLGVQAALLLTNISPNAQIEEIFMISNRTVGGFRSDYQTNLNYYSDHHYFWTHPSSTAVAANNVLMMYKQRMTIGAAGNSAEPTELLQVWGNQVISNGVLRLWATTSPSSSNNQAQIYAKTNTATQVNSVFGMDSGGYEVDLMRGPSGFTNMVINAYTNFGNSTVQGQALWTNNFSAPNFMLYTNGSLWISVTNTSNSTVASITLSNAGAALTNTPQRSPSMQFWDNGWSGLGGTNVPMNFELSAVPVNAAGAQPSETFVITSKIGPGGTVTTNMQVTSGGNVTIPQGITVNAFTQGICTISSGSISGPQNLTMQNNGTITFSGFATIECPSGSSIIALEDIAKADLKGVLFGGKLSTNLQLQIISGANATSVGFWTSGDTNAGGRAFKAGDLYANTNLFAGKGTFTNGVSSTASNLLAPTSFTFPATTANWTNPLGICIEVYIDNTAVTGTSVKKNGGTIFSGLSTDITLGLQPGEYFSETYSVGTPVGTYSPR